MSAKKFEKLIDLIINEDQERANQLFHEIVVEKSREIYESIIEEDSIDGLEDEVSADDEGAMDDLGDEEFSDEEFGDEEGETDLGDEDFGDEEGSEEGDLEDRVVDLEDKLDELMAEFEAQMGGDDEDMGDEDMDMDMGDEDMGDEEGDDEEAGLMEAAQMTQVGGKTYDKFGKMGNDGEQTKSAGLQNPKRIGDGGSPVQFSSKSEAAPKAAKRPSNYIAKGEKTEDFGNINTVGGNAGKTAFKTKAPAPKTETVNAKSTLPESKTTTKRRI
jgi:hypothetical protein